MSSKNALAEVLTSVNHAKGLPNAHYVNTDVFEQEKTSVLFANWAGIGFAKDVPQSGDVKPIEFLGMPLLVLRDKNGEVKVFQNTCRHRGMVLVDTPRNIRGPIRCPYHSWCYDFDGALKSTPHVGGSGENTHPDIDANELGLIPIRHHVWRDVVFVNVNGTAPPFEECHADLLDRWREFEQPLHHGGQESSFTLEVKTNWKLAVENYCESYHLPWIHPELNTYSRLEDHYNIEVRDSYSGQGTLVYKQLKDEDGNTLPDFHGLSEKWDEGAEYIAVYPNVLLGVQRDHSFAIVLEPVGCSETIEHIEIYYAQAPEEAPQHHEMRVSNAKLWKTVFEEDIFVVEGMQKGRHGVHFDGGRFSPVMDGPTHNFHHWVATQINRQQS
jgi:phenylpropionate dioxygenase-like ring-hydroxylating dioxygenase large terminal subunit